MMRGGNEPRDLCSDVDPAKRMSIIDFEFKHQANYVRFFRGCSRRPELTA